MPKNDKFRRLLPRDPFRLHSVEEWLRGFREQPLPNFDNVVYCRKCGIRIYTCSDHVPIPLCHGCGLSIRRLDETFWQGLSNCVERRYRKEPLLFARLNAECAGVPLVPKLHGPLAWVTVEWEKAAKALGRPRGLERQLFLASWLFALARPRLVMEHGEHSSEFWIRERSGNPRRLFPPVLPGSTPERLGLRVIPPIMTLSGAIKVLMGSDLKQAICHTVKWRQRQLFGGLSTKQLMQFRLAFQNDWKKQFGGTPIRLSRREAERMLMLHKNIQIGGVVRLKGLKLRDKKSKKTEVVRDRGIQPPDAQVDSVLNRTCSKKVVGDV